MLAQHAVNVYVISATIWEVMIPVLGVLCGAVIGSLIAMYLMTRSHNSHN